jgi:hypothetical protein
MAFPQVKANPCSLCENVLAFAFVWNGVARHGP